MYSVLCIYVLCNSYSKSQNLSTQRASSFQLRNSPRFPLCRILEQSIRARNLVGIGLSYRPIRAGIVEQSVGARNRVGTGLSKRPTRVRIFEQSMEARNRLGRGLTYQPARLHRLAGRCYNLVPTQFLDPIYCSKTPAQRLRRLAELISWNRFLGSLKFKISGSVYL